MNNHTNRRRRRWLTGAALGICLGMWAGTLCQLHSEERAADARAAADVTATARAYARYLVRSLEQLDQITMQLKFEWESSKGALKLEDMRKEGLYTAGLFQAVAILDRQGNPLTATVAFEGVRSAGPTAHLFKHRRSNSSAMNIAVGKPMADGAKPVLHLTRRLEDERGEFAGVIAVSIDPDYLSDFYAGSAMERGVFLAMVGEDGEFYATRAGAGVAHAHRPLFSDTRFLEAEAGMLRLAEPLMFADHRARFVGWQALGAYPFSAVVGLREVDVHRPLRDARLRALVLAALSSALVSLAAFLAVRRHDR